MSNPTLLKSTTKHRHCEEAEADAAISFSIATTVIFPQDCRVARFDSLLEMTK